MTAALRSPFARGFTPEHADDLAGTLKALADPNRLRIIALLNTFGEMSGVEIQNEMYHIAMPTVIHHLTILREAGFVVDGQMAGRWARRRLDCDAVAEVGRLLRRGRAR